MNDLNNTQPYQKQLDEVFCSSCGKPIKKEAEICPYCGVRVKQNKDENISDKDWSTCLLLCLFLGIFGGHRFYVGKTVSGILYLFTLGGFVIGAVIDLICIISGTFRDNERKFVRYKSEKKLEKRILIAICVLIFIFIIIGINKRNIGDYKISSSSNSVSKEDREARENSRIVEMKEALSGLKNNYDEFNQIVFYSQKRFTAYRNSNHFKLDLAISTDYKLKSVNVSSCIVYNDTILGISELIFLYGTNTYKFNTGFQSFDAGLTPDWKYYSYFGKTLNGFEEEKFINYLENFSKANTAKIQYRGLGGMRTDRTLTKNEKLAIQDVIKAYRRIKEINKEYGI